MRDQLPRSAACPRLLIAGDVYSTLSDVSEAEIFRSSMDQNRGQKIREEPNKGTQIRDGRRVSLAVNADSANEYVRRARLLHVRGTTTIRGQESRLRPFDWEWA